MMKKTFKPKIKREFLKTNKKEVVDYFPRGGSKEDFTYNTAIVDKGAIRDVSEKKAFLKKKRNKSAKDAKDTPKAEDLEEKTEEELIKLQIETELEEKNANRAMMPKFKTGDLVLLTISEIRKDYMIANFTRNKKAMIHRNYSGLAADKKNFSFLKYFKVGQFVCGAVVSPGNDIQLTEGYMNKKLLVSIEPKIVNTGLHGGNVIVGMDLYGKLVKQEGKFTVDFQFTDEEEEIVKFGKNANKKKSKFDFDDEESGEGNGSEEEKSQHSQEEKEESEEEFDIAEYTKQSKKRKSDKKNQTSHNIEINLIDNTEAPEIFADKITDSFYFFKLTNIEKLEDKTILTVSLNYTKYKFPVKKCDFKFLRPGFFFKSNGVRDLTNGVEVAFAGNIGTIFSDHLKSHAASNEKNKNMLSRIIHISLSKSSASLSTKKHVVNLQVDDIEKKAALVGKIYSGLKVDRLLYGNSYGFSLDKTDKTDKTAENTDKDISAFLHNSQIMNRETTTFKQDEEIEKLLVKEYNYFDDRAMLTARTGLIENDFFTWDNLTVGRFVKGNVEEIKSDCLVIRLNGYIQGKLLKDHITDYPLGKIPKKYKLGQVINCRIFAYDVNTKFLTFTTKESLMDEKSVLTGDISKLIEGQDLNVIYVGNSLFAHSGNVMAKLLNFNKIENKENFKVGKLYTYKVYKVNIKYNKIFLTNETEVWQPGVGDYENLLKRNPILTTISTLLNQSEADHMITSGSLHEFQILSTKRLVKLLLKHGVDHLILEENIETVTKKFLIARMNVENGLYAIIPHELMSDYFQEKITNIYSKLKSNEAKVSKMLVLYHNTNSKILFVSPKKSLIANVEKIPSFSNLINDHLYYGFVNKKAKNGVVVQFLDNDKSLIRLGGKPDLNKEEPEAEKSVSKINFEHLQLGQTVAAKFRQNDKSTKKKFDLNVYQSTYRTVTELREESIENLNSYLDDLALVLAHNTNNFTNLKINTKVEGKIGIVKEYGILISIKSEKANVTGFLKNEHMSKESSEYKVSATSEFKIIDIDFIDSIVYLTDCSLDVKEISTEQFYKANEDFSGNFIIELFHDNYISACLQDNKSVKVILPCNLLNFNYEASQLSDVFKIGDVVTSKVSNYNSVLDKIIIEPPTKLLTKIQTALKSQKTKAEIASGNIINARINGVKGGYVFVYINKTTLGRIHSSDFVGDLDEIKDKLKTLHAKDAKDADKDATDALKIKCRILHVEQKKDVKICDLTNNIVDASDINMMTKVLDTTGEKQNLGIISRVDVNSKYPIKIDHAAGNKKAAIHFSHITVENILNLKSVYKLGDKINFYSKSNSTSGENESESDEYTYSILPFSMIQKQGEVKVELDKVYPVRVLKSIPGRGLIVDLSIFNNHTEAFVDICEISDDLHPNPLILFKNGTLTVGRVLQFDSKSNKYFLSLRNSIVDDEHYSIIKSGSTIKFNKKFDSFEKVGDYRNKVMKFGVSSVVEANLVAIGYITSSSEKGVFIKLASDVIVRASHRELTDEKTTKPYLLFKQDSLVLCRVISIYKPKDSNEKMNINVSLRESVVKFNLTLRTKDLVPNNFYLCSVMNTTSANDKFEVCIVGSTFTGLLKKKNIKANSQNSINRALEKKHYILLQLVKLDKNSHPPKLRFGNINTDNVDSSITINSISKEDEAKNLRYSELYSNVLAINEKYKQDEVSSELKELEKNVDKIDYESLITGRAQEDDSEGEGEDDEEGEELDAEEELAMLNDDDDSDDNAEVIVDHKIKAQFLKGLGISFNNDNTMQVNDEVKEEHNNSEDEMQVDEDSDEGEDNNTNAITNTNLKSSKKREKNHLREELNIREKEEKTTKFDNTESVEFFEKQILSDANNSIYWIQYAAYILDKLGLPAARKIFERAITTINISLIKEKMNVWIAYMNLENTYGNSDTFKSSVTRALEVNDKKTIYKHLISIYKLSGKLDLAYEVYKILTKNFFSDFSVWKNYMEFLFEVDQEKQNTKNKALSTKLESMFIEPKEGLNKALQVLGKNKHVEVLIFYGGLQYKFNYVEEARTTFESILRNFPKRSDIWSVYIDKEIKHTKNVDKVRSIFEKVLDVDFKVKILKTLISKYLQFEKDHGTAKSLEHVKALTAKLIMGKMSKLKDNEDEDEIDNNGNNDMEVDN